MRGPPEKGSRQPGEVLLRSGPFPVLHFPLSSTSEKSQTEFGKSPQYDNGPGIIQNGLNPKTIWHDVYNFF